MGNLRYVGYALYPYMAIRSCSIPIYGHMTMRAISGMWVMWYDQGFRCMESGVWGMGYVYGVWGLCMVYGGCCVGYGKGRGRD